MGLWHTDRRNIFPGSAIIPDLLRLKGVRDEGCAYEDIKMDWQSWRHYDERWESEGQEAFREYAGHRNAKAGGPPDRAE